MPDVFEAYDEAYEESYDESFDESFDEAFRPRRVTTARPTTPPGRGSDSRVTQQQLQMAIKAANANIARNSSAIQQVNRNLTTLGRDVRRQTTGARDSRKDIGQLRDALMIMPLLQGTLGSGSTLGTLLPFLLLQGVGETRPEGGSSSGGLFGGGDSTSSTILPLLLLSGGLGGGSRIGGGTP